MKKTSNLSSTIAAYSTVSSWENIPHVSFIYEADITDLYQNYLFLKEKNSNITFNTVCIKLIAEAIHDCNTKNTRLGTLVANRELPILYRAKEIIDDIESE